MAYYLVIASEDIGGAEKRLISIWRGLQKPFKGEAKLVLTPSLLDKIQRVPEFQDIGQFADQTLPILCSGGYLKKLSIVRDLMQAQKEPSVFHFVLDPPLVVSKLHKTVMTFPSLRFGRLSLKGLLATLLGFYFSDHVDVLDPRMFKFIRKLPFLDKTKVTLTPGSAVDFSTLLPSSEVARRNHIVLLGLQNKDKQLDRFLRVLPRAHALLSRDGYADLKYFILGRVGDIDAKRVISEDSDLRQIDIFVGFEKDPPKVLRQAKIILSLQPVTNYPSRALLEGIGSGCLPLVTDVASTELIVQPEFSELVPRDFTAQHLYVGMSSILKLNDREYQAKSRAAIDWVKSRHSIEASVAYFQDLILALDDNTKN